MRLKYIVLLLLALLAIGLFFVERTGVTFWQVLLKNPQEVSAFCPCSSLVADEISSIIEHTGKPLRILEVGGGTGALTAGIVKHMQLGDTCDVIDIMPAYCKTLTEKFSEVEGLHIHCCSILDWHPKEPYDVIICSLPFNTFDVKFVDLVFDHLKRILKPYGKMSYIELMWISEWKKHFIGGDDAEKLTKTLERMAEIRSACCKKTVQVYWNITPIEVHHLEFM